MSLCDHHLFSSLVYINIIARPKICPKRQFISDVFAQLHSPLGSMYYLKHHHFSHRQTDVSGNATKEKRLKDMFADSYLHIGLATRIICPEDNLHILCHTLFNWVPWASVSIGCFSGYKNVFVKVINITRRVHCQPFYYAKSSEILSPITIVPIHLPSYRCTRWAYPRIRRWFSLPPLTGPARSSVVEYFTAQLCRTRRRE